MLSTVLAATAVLRRDFRRLRSVALLGAVTALGLIPLSLYMPRADWARYTLLSLVCLYAARKLIQFLRSRVALKQLSMEEHFLRYGSSVQRVRRCMEHDAHIWTHSCILGGLKGVMQHPITTDLIGDEKRDRVYRQFHRSFRKLEPARAILDGGLLLGMLVVLSLTPSITVSFGAVLFLAGFLSLAIASFAEISHQMIRRQIFETMRRVYGALTEWAIRDALQSAVTASYSHRRLYFAQPWFAHAPRPDGDGATGSAAVSPSGGKDPHAVRSEAPSKSDEGKTAKGKDRQT